MNGRSLSPALSRWIDAMVMAVVQLAARTAPVSLSERLQEEWLADVSARSGGFSRLRFALGCCYAAVAIASDHAELKAPVRNSPPPERPMASCASARLGSSPSLRAPSALPAGTVICDINTTPLIDVMLVLLVTLIVSLPLMTHAVILDLPRIPPSSDQIQPEVIDLDIDFDGTVVWNGTALASWQQLESHLHEEAQKTSQPEIHLRPDRRVKYDVVAKVLAAAQRNRMQKIGLANTAEFKE